MTMQYPHDSTARESSINGDLSTTRIAMHKPAKRPNDLERLFVERANNGDVDGLVALYEPNAILISDNGQRHVGKNQIREFLKSFLTNRPRLSPSIQHPALRCGDIALTSSRHSNGGVSVEIARRQHDGSWLWVIDRFTIENTTYHNHF